MTASRRGSLNVTERLRSFFREVELQDVEV